MSHCYMMSLSLPWRHLYNTIFHLQFQPLTFFFLFLLLFFVLFFVLVWYPLISLSTSCRPFDTLKRPCSAGGEARAATDLLSGYTHYTWILRTQILSLPIINAFGDHLLNSMKKKILRNENEIDLITRNYWYII